ncbi:polysaccharide lyase [Dictyobacter arantiisoli]|uniref:Polysaccharide lyase 14 domain-containing protein n=1 Tax=Dictyobacter arantiisoli TaxID=2014874 RepID=A0A5A5T8A5_9CHLR|nr:hypothetical protein [Dictyobacter arantiisoli]GCF07209.1 hypothetical protein KDI_07730 [Dictyobacter arantiisoli]
MRKQRTHLRAVLTVVCALAAIAMLTIASTANPLTALAATPATTHKYVKAENGNPQFVSTVVTWYGYDDNSGQTESQLASSLIAYGKSDGFPTLHNQTTEGKGTYDDPVTFAAPDRNVKTYFPVGSIIYVPFVKKYFIMEDQCAGCQDGIGHADLFMGPARKVGGDVQGCENNVTPNNAVNVIINPGPGFEVNTTPMFTSSGVCNIKNNLFYNYKPALTDGNNSSNNSNGSGSGATSTPTATSPIRKAATRHSKATPTPEVTAASTPDTTSNSQETTTCASSGSSSSPLWSSDFSSADWQKSWGIQSTSKETVGLSNLSVVDDPSGQLKQKVLQVAYSSTATSKQINGAKFLGTLTGKSSNCLYLSYDVYFPKGFVFANGGKLPGLYGGTAVEGNTSPIAGQGFSTRLMWTRQNGGGICAYLPVGSALNTARYAYDGRNTSIGQNAWKYSGDGQWHQIQQFVKLNTNPADQLPNGEVDMWYDNQQVIQASGVNYRPSDSSTLGINGIFFDSSMNGAAKGATPLPTTATMDYANFVVSDHLITSSVPTTSATGTPTDTTGTPGVTPTDTTGTPEVTPTDTTGTPEVTPTDTTGTPEVTPTDTTGTPEVTPTNTSTDTPTDPAVGGKPTPTPTPTVPTVGGPTPTPGAPMIPLTTVNPDGQYDLSVQLVSATQTGNTHTYQIKVHNTTGAVKSSILLGLSVVGNSSRLQLANTSGKNSGWTVVNTSDSASPHLLATYTGIKPGYPVGANSDLPVLTLTVTGPTSPNAYLDLWTDVSGNSRDANSNDNLLTQQF